MQDNKLTKALVLNAKLGNNSAFQQLYQMTSDQVYALIFRLTGNQTAAENLTKKTYVNAWQKISEKDEFTPILNWFKKIAVKTFIDEKNELEKLPENKLDEELFEHNSLEKIIQEQTYNNKLVFILHDIENLSLEEISKLTNFTEKEIKSLLVETRENLIKLTEE